MKQQRPRITVVGSFAVGLTLRATRFPVKGETLIGSDFDMGPGGKGSNQAVGAARLGAESHFVGLIGSDSFGQMGLALYQQEGVHVTHLRRTTERNTGVGFITLDAAGDNHIVLDWGANALLAPADVDAAEELIAASDVVLSVLEIRQETAGRAMDLARSKGAISILNPAPATRLSAEVLRSVDILTPNESELRVLLGLAPDDPADNQDLARQLLALGVQTVVITQGSRGALIVRSDGTIEEVGGISVDVVDTTGAGDAFNAALAVALAEGQSLSQAVRFATHVGALACTRLGVVPALPRRAEVEQLVALR